MIATGYVLSSEFRVPDDLTERDQWVLWRYESRNGKPTKVPYQVNGNRAKSDDSQTWNTFAAIVEAWNNARQRYQGVGFVFAAADPFAGIDLDDCMDPSGALKPWARTIIECFANTYMETSPSGRGVKVFVKARLDGRGHRASYQDGAVEIYDRGRFFTVTGHILNGAKLQVEEHQADVAKLYALISGGTNERPKAKADLKDPKKVPEGKRYEYLQSAAAQYRSKGMDREEIYAAIAIINLERCLPPKPDSVLTELADWAARLEVRLVSQPFTDTGNAERLVALHGRVIRFCPEMKKWLVWDGLRWNSEDSRRIKLHAKKTMREMYSQAAAIPDKDLREAAEKHARKSESAAGIHAMLSCAEYEEGIPVSPSELDQHPYLLNFKNGTLDLKTGALYAHRREDLLTKLVNCKFNPRAQCERFIWFICRIMGGGPSASQAEGERAARLVGYLQKCFGYALTGDVSEKVVFCLFGSGNNGKTTLLEAVRFVIAEYSTQVLIDSLMMHHSRESNASLADLADLRGARFVTTSEAEHGQRLAIGKLKYLTQGMGEIKTCRKFENPIKFKATHKLFLDANHKPVIRGAETAVWNRLKPIPFTVTIPPGEMDKALLDKLKGEAEGIAAWMVEGCRRWLEEGLGDPPEVTEASVAWQAESDRFPAFLEEQCVLLPDAWLPVSNLWPAYKDWCEENDERARLTKADFDERLRAMGCKQAKREGGTVRAWVGIRFRTPADDTRVEQDNGTPEDVKL